MSCATVEAARRAALLVKRDDLTGLATGGNKTRELEFLIADALAQRATASSPPAVRSRTIAGKPPPRPPSPASSAIWSSGGKPQPPLGNLLLDDFSARDPLDAEP